MADNSEDVPRKARRIVKILKQIAENLFQDEIITLRSKIKEAIEFAKQDQRNEVAIKKALVSHVQMLEFRAGISVNLLEQSVRALLMITENERLGNSVYEMFTDYMVEEHPTVIIGLGLDDELLKVYFKALGEGSELAGHIRLMVVGMYGVGKTTLVNRLLDKDTDKDPLSTVGIDISLNACEVDENKKWKMTKFEERIARYDMRLEDLFKKKNQRENNYPKEDFGTQETTVQTVVYETEKKQSSPVEKDETYIYTRSKKVETGAKETENTKNMKKVSKKLAGNNQEITDFYREMKLADENVKKKKKTVSKPTTVSIWDFAGQSVYYSTHHFFLNPRAIYLVVLDLSKPLDERVDEGKDSKGFENLNLGSSMTAHFTQLDAFRFWLKSIYIYTTQKRSTEPPSDNEYKPTIVLIGTHKDLVEDGEERTDAYANNYFNKALKSFRDHPVMDLIYKKRFFVSKDESSEVFASLRSEIYEIANKQPFFREEVPAKFIPLEKEVEKKKNDKMETMKFDELKNVSEDSPYPLSNEEILLFLRFQHAFGNILHYQKANPDTVILRPQWIIDAFKLFVSHKNNDISKEWTDLKCFGKLSRNLINNLMQTDIKWLPFEDEIIRYLEHLDIIAKPVKLETSQNLPPRSNRRDRWVVSVLSREHRESENFYFMPCMLPTRPTCSDIKLMLEKNGKSSPILCMFIEKAMLPPSVFHRILATCIKEMEVFKYKDAYVLYSSLGAFFIDTTTVLTIWTLDNMIYFKITSYHSDKETLVSTADLVQIRMHFQRLVETLFDTVGSENTENISHVKISYYVTCPKCPEQFPFDRDNIHQTTSNPFLVDLNDPWPEDGKVCNPNHHHIKGQDILTPWFRDKQLPGLESVDERLLRDYPEPFLENFLADLAYEIRSTKIDNLVTALHISQTRREEIIEDYGEPNINYKYHLLYEGSKTCQSLYIIQKAAEDAGCEKEKFYQLLDGRVSDEMEKIINDEVAMCSPEKMDMTQIDGRCGLELAGCIGEEFWPLGIRLGISEKELQRMFCDRHSCREDNIRKIFTKWRKKCAKPNEEALHELIRAMVKCKCTMRIITSSNVLGKP